MTRLELLQKLAEVTGRMHVTALHPADRAWLSAHAHDFAELYEAERLERGAIQAAPTEAGKQPSDLPDRIVVGANGAYWRDYGTHYSMCPVSDDNDPVEPVAVYVQAEVAERAVREALEKAREIETRIEAYTTELVNDHRGIPYDVISELDAISDALRLTLLPPSEPEARP